MFYNSNPTAFQQQPIFPQMPVRQPVAAIFLDAENIHARHLEYIVDKARQYGLPLNCRAYADWSNPRLKSYAGKLTKYGFVAIHHFATQMGKNSSDMMLSVDAMKMMYQPDRPDVVVLATSDSDFTSLVVQLRALGVMVVGVGNINASGLLKDACDAFHRIPDSDGDSSPPPKPKPAPQARTTPPTPLRAGQTDPNTNPKLIKALNEVLDSDMALDDGRVALNYVGTALLKAGVNAENLGFANASALIHSLNEFEIRQSNAGKPYMIRCLPFKNETAPKTPTTTPPTAPTPAEVRPPVHAEPAKRLLAGQKDPNNHKKLIETLHNVFNAKSNKDKIAVAEIGSRLKAENILPSDLGFGGYAEMLNWLDDFEVSADGKANYLARITSPAPTPAPASINAPQALDLAFKNAVAFAIANQQDEHGWAKVGKVSVAILNEAGISAIQYGYNTLSDAIKACDIFELYAHEIGGVKSDYVRDTRTTPDEMDGKIPVALEQSVKPKTTNPTPAVDDGNNNQTENKPDNKSDNKTENKPNNQPAEKSANAEPTLDAGTVTKLRQVILEVMQETYAGDVWFPMANFGSDFRKKGYNPKDYGAKTLGILMAKLGGYETKMVDTTSFVKDPNFVPKSAQSVETIKTDNAKPKQNTKTDNAGNQTTKLAEKSAEKAQALEVSNLSQSFENIETDKLPSQVVQLVADATDKTCEVIATIEMLENGANKMTDNAQSLEIIETKITETESVETQILEINITETETSEVLAIDDELTDDSNDDSGEFGVADLLILINQAITLYQDDDGYTKVGDIGKYVRKEIGLGATSFGYDDFGKMLELLPQYEVVRIGRSVMVKVKGE